MFIEGNAKVSINNTTISWMKHQCLVLLLLELHQKTWAQRVKNVFKVFLQDVFKTCPMFIIKINQFKELSVPPHSYSYSLMHIKFRYLKYFKKAFGFFSHAILHSLTDRVNEWRSTSLACKIIIWCKLPIYSVVRIFLSTYTCLNPSSAICAPIFVIITSIITDYIN